MFSYLKNLSSNRPAWILLAVFTLVFELCALFFQHGMKLDPCVMCIYERVAMFGVMAAALLGCIAPQIPFIRWIAILAWIATSWKGLSLSIEHVGYQFPDTNVLFGPTCDIFVDFPTWAPLNQWAPWLFEATGDCSKIVWQFLGYSMPQWLIVIFGAIFAVSITVALSQLAKNKE